MDLAEWVSLKDKVAVVTGASKGLGREFALNLSKAGAHVVITCRHEADLEETAYKIKALDILINNAGIERINKSPEETSLEEWNLVINTNVTGPFLCSKAAAPVMKKQHKGKIINLSSKSGFTDVIGVAPGYYETEPNRKFFINKPDLHKKVIDLIPFRRLGDITELSGLVVCLASDISNYMTGTTILIDGGYNLW
jgi:NAD(P)-dependent dehydrogenase (short-subunit alcohol dehydrogenase family)